MRYIIANDRTSIAYREPVKNLSFIGTFFKWTAGQDKNHHIAWIGICLLTTTAVFFPLTMAAIVLNGLHFSLIIVAKLALVMVFVLNLAAMPTRYTIPAFVLGILTDIVIIIISIFY